MALNCVTPRTFLQKLYQLHDLKIAERFDLEIANEFEQAIEANFLGGITKLLSKVLKIDKNR